jgi:hypothetical protein
MTYLQHMWLQNLEYTLKVSKIGICVNDYFISFMDIHQLLLE